MKSFELCMLTLNVACEHCLRNTGRGHIHCNYGTLLLRSQNNQEASEQVRRLTQERYTFLPPRYVIKKYLRRGPRNGQSCDQEAYYKARKAYRKALSKNFTSIHYRFLKDEKYRESKLEIGWPKENMHTNGCARTKTTPTLQHEANVPGMRRCG